MKKILVYILSALVFLGGNLPLVQAGQVLDLPVPGQMVPASSAFTPVLFKGLKIYPKEPLRFDFILDKADPAVIKAESERMAKYFLAAITIPENDLWVNLSPYEKDRTIPESLGQTDLGKDLLAQDYILKQFTATLIYPEKELGKAFWAKVYAKSKEKFGTTEMPVNTLNKVWILPDDAAVYEHGNAAYVTRAHLKVMLEEDYLALSKHGAEGSAAGARGTHPPVGAQTKSNESLPLRSDSKPSDHALASQIIREIVLPEIEKEVNTGKNFSPLRQIYYALILAKWYKETIKEGLLAKAYQDQSKIEGIRLDDPDLKDKIYERYLQAYKKGVFNYIKEESNDGQMVPRKYFSGGIPMMVKVERDSKVPDGLRNSAMVSSIQLGSAQVDERVVDVQKAGPKEVVLELRKLFEGGDQPVELKVVLAGDSVQMYKVLDWLGFEEDPNQRSNRQIFLNILNEKAVIKTYTLIGENSWRFEFKYGDLRRFKAVTISLNKHIESKELVEYLRREDAQFTVVLPQSRWVLPKAKIEQLAKILGVPANRVYYSGQASERKAAEEETRLKIEGSQKPKKISYPVVSAAAPSAKIKAIKPKLTETQRRKNAESRRKFMGFIAFSLPAAVVTGVVIKKYLTELDRQNEEERLRVELTGLLKRYYAAAALKFSISPDRYTAAMDNEARGMEKELRDAKYGELLFNILSSGKEGLTALVEGDKSSVLGALVWGNVISKFSATEAGWELFAKNLDNETEAKKTIALIGAMLRLGSEDEKINASHKKYFPRLLELYVDKYRDGQSGVRMLDGHVLGTILKMLRANAPEKMIGRGYDDLVEHLRAIHLQVNSIKLGQIKEILDELSRAGNEKARELRAQIKDRAMLATIDLTAVKRGEIEGELKKVLSGADGQEVGDVRIGDNYDIRDLLKELGFEETISQERMRIWFDRKGEIQMFEPSEGLFKYRVILKKELFPGLGKEIYIAFNRAVPAGQFEAALRSSAPKDIEVILKTSQWQLSKDGKDKLAKRMGLPSTSFAYVGELADNEKARAEAEEAAAKAEAEKLRRVIEAEKLAADKVAREQIAAERLAAREAQQAGFQKEINRLRRKSFIYKLAMAATLGGITANIAVLINSYQPYEDRWIKPSLPKDAGKQFAERQSFVKRIRDYYLSNQWLADAEKLGIKKTPPEKSGVEDALAIAWLLSHKEEVLNKMDISFKNKDLQNVFINSVFGHFLLPQDKKVVSILEQFILRKDLDGEFKRSLAAILIRIGNGKLSFQGLEETNRVIFDHVRRADNAPAVKANPAMVQRDGGIDMNNMGLAREGQRTEIDLGDSALAANVLGFTPTVVSVTPIASSLPLFNLQ